MPEDKYIGIITGPNSTEDPNFNFQLQLQSCHNHIMIGEHEITTGWDNFIRAEVHITAPGRGMEILQATRKKLQQLTSENHHYGLPIVAVYDTNKASLLLLNRYEREQGCQFSWTGNIAYEVFYPKGKSNS